MHWQYAIVMTGCPIQNVTGLVSTTDWQTTTNLSTLLPRDSQLEGSMLISLSYSSEYNQFLSELCAHFYAQLS